MVEVWKIFLPTFTLQIHVALSLCNYMAYHDRIPSRQEVSFVIMHVKGLLPANKTALRVGLQGYFIAYIYLKSPAVISEAFSLATFIF